MNRWAVDWHSRWSQSSDEPAKLLQFASCTCHNDCEDHPVASLFWSEGHVELQRYIRRASGQLAVLGDMQPHPRENVCPDPSEGPGTAQLHTMHGIILTLFQENISQMLTVQEMECQSTED